MRLMFKRVVLLGALLVSPLSWAEESAEEEKTQTTATPNTPVQNDSNRAVPDSTPNTSTKEGSGSASPPRPQSLKDPRTGLPRGATPRAQRRVH